MFEKIPQLVAKSETVSHIGKIENVVGMSMEASGGRSSIGDIVMIYNEEQNRQMPAEVVGFKDGKIQLMTYEATSGIASGSFVRNTRHRLKIPVGDFLRGRIINALGEPIDGGPVFPPSKQYTVQSPYINPLNRPPIRERLEFGVKAIDGLNTIGKGERGREVLEFIEKDLGEEGMKRSVLVVATSDQPAMLRMKCPLVATTIAEYFKDQGYDVLLMMDSLTRYAMAQREIGLAIGEPPIARGYTPSIYAEFPKLLERSGNFGKGSITGVYTVLVEGDDTNEPISDTVRGILDGHIVLSRQLANENHFPAIDIGASISRLMVEIVPKEHQRAASRFRNLLGLYQKNADLISIGAYKKGSNQALDEAVSKIDAMNGFLQQGITESFSYDETVGQIETITQ